MHTKDALIVATLLIEAIAQLWGWDPNYKVLKISDSKQCFRISVDLYFLTVAATTNRDFTLPYYLLVGYIFWFFLDLPVALMSTMKYKVVTFVSWNDLLITHWEENKWGTSYNDNV